MQSNPPPFPNPYQQQWNQPRGPRPVMIILIAGGLIAALFVGVFLIVKASRRPSRFTDTVEKKYEEAAGAFSAADATGSESEELPKIRATTNNYTAAINRKDYNAAMDQFDFDRMAQELKTIGVGNTMSRREEQGFKSGLRTGMQRSLSQPHNGMAFTSIEVKKVRMLPEKGEALVYLTGRHPMFGRMKHRWWMRKSGGIWRVYDLEELSAGMRVSTVMGLAAGGGGPNLAPWVGQTQNLMAVMQAAGSGDLAAAEQALKPLEGVNFPPQIQSIIVMFRGIILTGKDKHDEALKEYDQAVALNNDMPVIHYLRSLAYNAKGDPRKALASAQKFLDLLGNDAAAQLEAGKALEMLNRPAEALEAYRKGNDDDPEELEILASLARLLPATAAQELATRFEKCPDKKAAFATVADHIAQGPCLQAVVAVYKKTAPANDPALGFAEARAASLTGDHAKAITILQRVLPTLSADDDPLNYRDLLMRSYIKNKQLKEAEAQLNKLPAQDRNLAWVILIALSRNDAAAAETALNRWKNEVGGTKPLYDDADIGPLLNSPAFAALKAKFPPPR